MTTSNYNSHDDPPLVDWNGKKWFNFADWYIRNNSNIYTATNFFVDRYTILFSETYPLQATYIFSHNEEDAKQKFCEYAGINFYNLDDDDRQGEDYRLYTTKKIRHLVTTNKDFDLIHLGMKWE